MKQKIVIKVSMHCSKCRKKALKVAALADGVTSVALHGPEKDKLMIQGEEIDVACLTNSLKKKLCHASIETVEEVKEAEKKGKTESEEKNEATGKNGTKEPNKSTSKDQVIYCCPQQPQVEYYAVVSDPSPPLCSIL